MVTAEPQRPPFPLPPPLPRIKALKRGRGVEKSRKRRFQTIPIGKPLEEVTHLCHASLMEFALGSFPSSICLHNL